MRALRGNTFLAAMAAMFWPGASPAQISATLPTAPRKIAARQAASIPLSAPIVPSIPPISENHRGYGPWLTRSAGWRQSQRRKLRRRTGR